MGRYMPKDSMKFIVDSAAQKLMYFIVAIFIIGSVFIVFEVISGGDLFTIIFLVCWVIGATFIVKNILKEPTSVELNSKECILIFSNKFRTKSYDIVELQKISVDNSVLEFSFKNSNVEMANQITGLHILINKIKKLNSVIEVYGC
jgi:membrane-bound ClpP family serine protease